VGGGPKFLWRLGPVGFGIKAGESEKLSQDLWKTTDGNGRGVTRRKRKKGEKVLCVQIWDIFNQTRTSPKTEGSEIEGEEGKKKNFVSKEKNSQVKGNG